MNSFRCGVVLSPRLNCELLCSSSCVFVLMLLFVVVVVVVVVMMMMMMIMLLLLRPVSLRRTKGERAREVSDRPAVFRFVAGEKRGARPGPQLRDAHVLDGPNLGPIFGNAGEGGPSLETPGLEDKCRHVRRIENG